MDIAVLFADGFEEIELVAPVDIARRAELDVRLISLSGEPLVTGRSGMKIQANETGRQPFVWQGPMPRAVFLPGGPGVKALRERPDLIEALKLLHQNVEVLAAICAAPLLLADAGLLEGQRFTAHASTWDELDLADRQEKVVHSGSLLTSLGAGTAVEFGLKLVSLLKDEGTSKSIAQGIHFY
ncbi:MAG: DJ-1/PfpI family protein [Verrucomicrobiales bacterium]